MTQSTLALNPVATPPFVAAKSTPMVDLTAFTRHSNGRNSVLLSVKGAKCGGCLQKIETAALALPGMQTARLNLSTGKLEVVWCGDLTANEIANSVCQLGFDVAAYNEDAQNAAQHHDERDLLIAMGIAGFAAANIMLLSVSVWSGHGEMGQDTRQIMHAISGGIALPVLIYCGRHFFHSAWAALRHGHANMDVPISLALILAFSVSVWETALGGAHAYFDASIMLLFFLLIGRFLDARLRRQAYSAAKKLAALQNSSVNRFTSTGRVETVRADAIEDGDTLIIASGERVVIDMVLRDGPRSIDESLVTGESLPRDAQSGDTLYAGTLNLGQSLTGRAIGTASDSLLSDIARMLETGEQNRARYRKLADKAVSLYVPLVHATAALAFIIWILLGAGIREAVMIAVATLIITCPCALALAAPVTQIVASGRLFRHGVYLRTADALERLAEIDHIVFDKTGTLTHGKPYLVDADATHLADAARLARASRHPLSNAISEAAGSGPIAENVREVPGYGLETHIDHERWRLGSAQWVGAQDVGQLQGPRLWLAKGESDPVCFQFQDQVQDDAKATVAALAQNGLELQIVSGDAASSVANIARELEIPGWQAGKTPHDKARILEQLIHKGRKPLMIGDGLNDAGALSLAHASLTPGGAIDISQAASDAVYSGGLGSISTVLNIAKRARAILQQNFAAAAAYNLIAVPIAVTGHVTPLIAAICMSASSLLVTLNALRLNYGAAR